MFVLHQESDQLWTRCPVVGVAGVGDARHLHNQLLSVLGAMNEFNQGLYIVIRLFQTLTGLR